MIPLSLGIFLQEYTNLFFLTPVFLISGFLLISVAFWPLSASLKYRMRFAFGLGTFLLLLSAGIFQLHSRHTNHHVLPEGECMATLVLESQPEEKTNTFQAYATLLNIRDTTQQQTAAASTPLFLYFPKDSVSAALRPGQVLVTHARIGEIRNNGNPDEFDFARFMRQKGIYYSASIRKSLPTTRTPPFSIRRYALQLREKCLQKLETLLSDRGVYSFVSALAFGYRDTLPDEIREDFVQSGLSHILAVSGLHTGILFLLIMTLLAPLRIFRMQKASYLSAILILWGYACLTGLSPSVVRAACMISVLLVGKMIDEKSEPLNALFITAFFMLLVHPEYLREVGFQMSFLAVLSILVFYPLLKSALPVPHAALEPVVDLVLVSLSAQILVLPVSLYYFHLLPVWFLPANLLIIPLLTPFMLLVFLTLAFEFTDFHSPFLIRLITESSELILKTSRFFSELPSSGALYPSLWEIAGCFVLISAFTLFIVKRKPVYLITTLLTGLVWIGIAGIRPSSHRQEIIIFNQRSANTLHFIDGNRHFLITPDSGFRTNQLQAVYRPFLLRNQIDEPTVIHTDTLITEGPFVRYPFIEIQGKRFCFLTDNRFAYTRTTVRPKVDYLIAGGKYGGTPAQMRKITEFDTLLLAPTLSNYRRERLLALCDSMHIPAYDISRRGAFRLPLGLSRQIRNQRSDAHSAGDRSDSSAPHTVRSEQR